MRLVIPPLCVERGRVTWTVPGPGPCWEIAMNVRFGSKAACQQFNSRAAGYGQKRSFATTDRRSILTLHQTLTDCGLVRGQELRLC